jgi:hypothetical protein
MVQGRILGCCGEYYFLRPQDVGTALLITNDSSWYP